MDSSGRLVAELQDVSRVLAVIYSTCVTAELALQRQNADHDRDILTTLRMHVSEPVSRQAERLEALLAELAPAELALAELAVAGKSSAQAL